VNFRLLIAYLGNNFSGFQFQENARTVEAELKSAIKAITNQEVIVHAAGRTDAGVHAQGQVVSIEVPTRLKPRQLMLALAAKLPKDVAVWRIDQMPLGFNARRQSIGKRYVYRIYQGLVASPFLAATSYHVRAPLDLVAMEEAASSFVGEHDFSSFRAIACTASHARRFLWLVALRELGPVIEIDIRGNAFCMNMVRIMVGSLLEVGKGRLNSQDIKNALLSKDRRLAGPTAPPYGLSLDKVYFPDDLVDAKIPEGAVFPRYPVTKETWSYDPANIVYGPTIANYPIGKG
jgi:tRNA pseudouridine38-40 synthase